MTLSASEAQDTLVILGRQGVVTAETETPDTITINADLSALSGLTIDSNKKLKVNTDNTTVTINASNQLRVIGSASSTLVGLSDVTISLPTNDQVLGYVGGWGNKSFVISGSVAQSANGAISVISSFSSPSLDTVSAQSHNHSVSTLVFAPDDHYHEVTDTFGDTYATTDASGTPLSGINSVGTPLGGGTSVITGVSGSQPVDVTNLTHTHSSGDLRIDL